MEESKLEIEHLDQAVKVQDENESDIYQTEPPWAHYIPGAHNPTQSLKQTGKPLLRTILTLAGLAITFFGYDASVMSLVNTNPNYLNLIHTNSNSKKDSATIGGIVSIWFLGFPLGALLSSYFADHIGRLRTIFLGTIIALIGAILQTGSNGLGSMLVARVVGGIGCGFLNTVVPIWTSEIAEAGVRGGWVGVEFFLAIGGSVGVYWVEYLCLKTRGGGFAWRFPVGFQAVWLLGILVFLVAGWVPESPRYLYKIGRERDARDVLRACRLEGDETVEIEMSEIKAALLLEKHSSKETGNSLLSILTTTDTLHTRRRILLGCGVQIMQKLTGIDFISTYAPEMFGLAGYTGDKPALLAGGNLIGYAFSLGVSIFLADRLGRRGSMMLGSTCMGVVLIVGGVLAREVVRREGRGDVGGLGAGVAVVLYLYTFFYGSTWLTTCWVYPTEIFPLSSRAKGVALATFAFSITGGVINEIVPYLINAIGYWVFILFALINFAMLIPIWLFYIETANRHLEDLDLLFAGKSNFSWRAEREFAALKAREAEGLGGR